MAESLMPIGVFIIASVRLYRQGICQVLRADARFDVVGTAATSAEALARIQGISPRPAVALLDVGAAEGLDVARRLRSAAPETRVIALAIDDSERDVIAWAEAGVAGFVTRDTSLEDLVATVECVVRGGTRCSPEAAGTLMRRVAFLAERHQPGLSSARLTAREREVVGLIDQGLSNKQIARELHIELTTVKNHVHSVLEKLHVERRGAAAAVMRGEHWRTENGAS
jgi:DNA-binding NarL/FixJ family response regulator